MISILLHVVETKWFGFGRLTQTLMNMNVTSLWKAIQKILNLFFGLIIQQLSVPAMIIPSEFGVEMMMNLNNNKF